METEPQRNKRKRREERSKLESSLTHTCARMLKKAGACYKIEQRNAEEEGRKGGKKSNQAKTNCPAPPSLERRNELEGRYGQAGARGI